MLDTIGDRLRGEGDGGRGQSEVIGVILLVAIAIVLAAVIGEIVFGLDIVQSGEQNVGPQISFSTETDGGELIIQHESGDKVETGELTVIGSQSGDFNVDWGDQDVNDEWTSGESITIPPNSGETVRIIWESSTSDESTVVFETEFSG